MIFNGPTKPIFKGLNSIIEDKESNLWFGTQDGLCKYDRTTFIEFRTKDGHTFDVILFIIEDAIGNVWFDGKNGLWKFDGEKVTDFTM